MSFHSLEKIGANVLRPNIIYGASGFVPGFWQGSCYSIFSFLCMFGGSLFALLSFSFWPLCCLSFDLRILISPLVSSNSSLSKWGLQNTQTLPLSGALNCKTKIFLEEKYLILCISIIVLQMDSYMYIHFMDQWKFPFLFSEFCKKLCLLMTSRIPGQID